MCVFAAALSAAAADANDPNAARARVTPEQIRADIARLLQDKPEVPVTSPLNMAKPAAAAELPKEGTMVVDRLCRMWSQRNSPWLIVAFEHEPGRRDESDRRVLPNELMERMEMLAARTPGILFRISGETTIYEDHAYILLSKVTVLPPETGKKAGSEASGLKTARELAAGNGGAATDANTAAGATTKPTNAPTGDGADDDGPTSTDLLRAMLGEKVGKPINTIPVLPDSHTAKSVAPTSPQTLPVARGAVLSDRLVRIAPDSDGWWAASFVADNTLQEPPMRLLPCGMLTKARELAAKARPGRTRVLRISGKVTKYEGRRYLLLRKVLVELNLGQF